MLANLGCVQHALGKSNTAALCFAQALRTHAQHQKGQQVSQYTSHLLCVALHDIVASVLILLASVPKLLVPPFLFLHLLFLCLLLLLLLLLVVMHRPAWQ